MDNLTPLQKYRFEKQGYSLGKIKKMMNGELCSHCGCQPPRPGFKTCIRCSNQSNLSHKKNRPSILIRERERRANNREKYKAINLKKNLKRCYNITPDMFNSLNKLQHGLCAICLKPSGNGRLHVDHDHKNGRIRGLLCWNCNVALGAMAEDIDRLFSAITYLEMHKMEQMAGAEKTAQG